MISARLGRMAFFVAITRGALARAGTIATRKLRSKSRMTDRITNRNTDPTNDRITDQITEKIIIKGSGKIQNFAEQTTFFKLSATIISNINCHKRSQHGIYRRNV